MLPHIKTDRQHLVSYISPLKLVSFTGRFITLDNNNTGRYYLCMIKSFAEKETEKLFNRQFSKKPPQNIQYNARTKLEILDSANVLQDLTIPPGNQLEGLSGSQKGQHSIRINAQWRICFVWRDGDVYDVEIVDYHKG